MGVYCVFLYEDDRRMATSVEKDIMTTVYDVMVPSFILVMVGSGLSDDNRRESVATSLLEK